MKFTLTIKTGNDAMETPGDVAAALRKVADRIGCPWLPGDTGTILDANGNTVGRWEMNE